MVINEAARCLGLGSPMKGTGGWKKLIASGNGTGNPREESQSSHAQPGITSLKGRNIRRISFFGARLAKFV